MPKETLVYLISPVRQVTSDQAKVIAFHAQSLKKSDVVVFNPVKDAPQDDKTGFNIVMAELLFMHRASQNTGRVDVLWNVGGTPSEGSRVDLGIALALDLSVNLITIFNSDCPTGPQIAYEILQKKHSAISKLLLLLQQIEQNGKAIIDWDTKMSGEEQEWQRIYLGLALGLWARNPNLKIKMGKLTGEDPPDKKSYPKVIREIENRQHAIN